MSQHSQLIFLWYHNCNQVALQAVPKDENLINDIDIRKDLLKLDGANEFTMAQFEYVFDSVNDLQRASRHDLTNVTRLNESILSHNCFIFIWLLHVAFEDTWATVANLSAWRITIGQIVEFRLIHQLDLNITQRTSYFTCCWVTSKLYGQSTTRLCHAQALNDVAVECSTSKILNRRLYWSGTCYYHAHSPS